MASEKDNVNAGLIATITIAGALVVWAVVMVLTAYTRAEVREQQEVMESTANLGAMRRHIASEHEDMHAPAEWWDQEAQVVKIPTTHAEGLVVRDIAANPYAATPGSAPPPPPAPEGEEGEEGAAGEPAEGAAAGEPPTDKAAGTTAPEGTPSEPKAPAGTEEK